MAIEQIRDRTLQAWRPPPRLQLSTWIEREIRLPAGVSALPGPVRLWPWQVGICDAISDPLIERITLIKGVRLGFSTLAAATIGSFVANEPSPLLLLMPTESDARDVVVSDLEPIFRASPILQGAMADDAEEGERNTLLSKRFPGGGSLKIVAARSPRNLRRHTVRILIVDEADACEATPEGNPLRLAERRTLTFANRKIIIGSTPIFTDTSNVIAAYNVSDQRVFECPCPECGGFTEIIWSMIVWPEDEPGEAAFKCPHCEATVSEIHKSVMVTAGRWRVTKPEIKGHAGFRLNALVSLLHNTSWGRLAQEFIACKDDPAELQVFTNTILGQGWSSPSMVDQSALAARAEDFDLEHIPPEVLFITVGVDVGDDHLEASIVGWTRTSVCLVLAHHTIWGNFTDTGTWDELDELLRTRWRHPYGGRLGVDAAVIDAGDGDHYDTVLNFCVPKMRRRVFAGKGLFGARTGFAMAKGKTIANRLALIGVDTLKNVIFDRLQRGHAIRFSKSLEPIYYEQLCAERRVVRYSHGQPIRRFERIGRVRSEALDCLVYAHAARTAVQISPDRREAELHGTAPPSPSLAARLAR